MTGLHLRQMILRWGLLPFAVTLALLQSTLSNCACEEVVEMAALLRWQRWLHAPATSSRYAVVIISMLMFGEVWICTPRPQGLLQLGFVFMQFSTVVFALSIVQLMQAANR